MLIAICDDEPAFRSALRSAIVRYKAERRLHIDVCEFSAGEKLLNCGKTFDMVFLDYQMPGLDGLEVARELRSRNCTCSIVFVTAYPQFILDSFEVQPYRFFVKPLEEDQVVRLLNTFIAHQKLLAPLIVINDGEQYVIPAREILYLEGDDKYCIIRTRKHTYHSSKTLAQAHALLPQHCFYRSHKSYVINLYSVRNIEKGRVLLTNGEYALVGRSKAAEIRRVYQQFVKEYFVKI